MSEQPQEYGQQPQDWTPELVRAMLLVQLPNDCYQYIADAHNAALAAAKTDLRDMKRLYQDTYLHTIPKLEQQLDAERERNFGWLRKMFKNTLEAPDVPPPDQPDAVFAHLERQLTEWTPERILWFKQELPDTWPHKLADAINTAIAANKEYLVAMARDEAWEEVTKLKQQLAAEREKRKLIGEELQHVCAALKSSGYILRRETEAALAKEESAPERFPKDEQRICGDRDS
jgi:hypothetical protein